MAETRRANVIVIGEGDTEEGESFRRSGSPGDPIHDDSMGALHVLAVRVFREILDVDAMVVWPPRVRSGRRTGNPGLLYDLAGRPRRRDIGSEVEVVARPWLASCVGRARADLVIVVKDVNSPGNAEATRARLLESMTGSPPDLRCIAAAATPSIEGWLLPIDETERLDERHAKARWNQKMGSGSIASKVERARGIDLDALRRYSPSGFDHLIVELERWAASR